MPPSVPCRTSLTTGEGLLEVQAADWVMKHPGVVQSELRCRFMEMVTPTRLVVYGTPSLQVKDALAVFSPVCIVAFGSFSR
jgi:aconitase A